MVICGKRDLRGVAKCEFKSLCTGDVFTDTPIAHPADNIISTLGREDVFMRINGNMAINMNGSIISDDRFEGIELTRLDGRLIVSVADDDLNMCIKEE